MALRNSISQSTKFAPFKVIFGKIARLDWQFREGSATQEYQSEDDNIKHIIQLQRH